MASPDPAADKPTAEALGWRVGAPQAAFESSRFDVKEYPVDLSAGEKSLSFAVVERAVGVIIIPVTAAGEIVLISQYRFPVDAWCVETPAGTTSDTGSMPLEDVVRKELKEEVGGTSGRIERVGEFFSAPAYSTERCVVFIAWEVELSAESEREPTENIRVEIVAAAEAVRRAETGAVHNAACAIALCLSRRKLQAAGWL